MIIVKSNFIIGIQVELHLQLELDQQNYLMLNFVSYLGEFH